MKERIDATPESFPQGAAPESEEQASFEFERQFQDIEKMELPGGTVEVADLTPKELEDKVPIFLAPSWGCDLKTYKPLLKELFKFKRRVMSLNHSRIGGKVKPDIAVEEIAKKYPNAELRKALNILEILEEKGVEQVDAIAHSEAAINVAIAATMYPEKFRSIQFLAPAGMLNKENIFRLGMGFFGQRKRAASFQGAPAKYDEQGNMIEEEVPEIPVTETEKAVGKAAMESLGRYVGANPLRSGAEVWAMAYPKVKTYEMLQYLHEQGIKIAIVSGADDPVFPREDIAKASTFKFIDTFVGIRGGHGAVGDQPELRAPLVKGIFDALARKAGPPRSGKSGVRYIPGQGLVIAPYVKQPRPGEKFPAEE